MIPYRNDSQAVPLDLNQTAAEVVFVGNHCNFSDSLIAATGHELGGITSAVMGSFAELRRMLRVIKGTPGVLLMDEPTLRTLGPDDRHLLQAMPGLSLGLAFSTLEYGIAARADPLLRGPHASIFPLNVRLDVWLSIIKLIAHGSSYVCPDVIAAHSDEDRAAASGEFGLTQRQMDVLQLVADGQSNKCIAERLGLSIHTVKLHLHNGSLRLGARNRTEAAMRYREMRP